MVDLEEVQAQNLIEDLVPVLQVKETTVAMVSIQAVADLLLLRRTMPAVAEEEQVQLADQVVQQ